MHRLASLVFIAAAAHEPALPWVMGFPYDAATSTMSKAVPDLLDEWRRADPDCVASRGGMEITTSRWQIDASFTQGVFVMDRASHHLIASAPPFECMGSADELVALAAGGPFVVVAVTQGGHRVAETWLYVYRVGEGTLEQVFAQPVEERDGDTVRTGTVSFEAGTIVFHGPSGHVSQWSAS